MTLAVSFFLTSQALGDVGLQWEASMSTFLGQTGRVKTVQMKEGKQVVEAWHGEVERDPDPARNRHFSR